ncbi:unnamed protein product [Blepharisma stoltei]|uniref:Uncharacterized protein n=1 Tax=Blepharisma stoltei TaxID=1481888 RepID=A0AAU9K2B3_9CILI|nr:unnamed protein product [Blepharisma stoltei]
MPLNDCAQKVIFFHELAHHIRKTKGGFYDINQKTPDTKSTIFKGAPGAKKATQLRSTNEGGWQLESELFSVFFVKICDKQINFLNIISSWNLPLQEFKYWLRNAYSEHSNKYQLGRGKDGLYSLERRGHNDNKFD